jgi:hypothetical protein
VRMRLTRRRIGNHSHFASAPPCVQATSTNAVEGVTDRSPLFSADAHHQAPSEDQVMNTHQKDRQVAASMLLRSNCQDLWMKIV